MKFISRKMRAASAAKGWRAQYGFDRDDVASRIDALGPKPDPESVNEIIGNDTWTRCDCDECGREVEFVVEFGEYQDYALETARICEECVGRAMAIVLGQKAK